CGILEKRKIFKWHFWRKLKKQDLVLLAEELGQKVSDKNDEYRAPRNIIIGSKDYEEEFVRDQLSVILEEHFEREKRKKIARQLAIEGGKIARQHAIQQLRWESELNELRIGGRGTCEETSPAVLMAEATIPVTTPIKEEKGMDDLRVCLRQGQG
ncbi:hypothetical protein TNCV_4826571, partial [Trichonephila clavipes]